MSLILKKHFKCIALAAVYASSASLVSAASVLIDFNTDDAGDILLAGTGAPGTGISIGTDGVGPNGVASNPTKTQPYGNIYSSLGVGTGGITFTDTTNVLTLYNSDGDGGNDEDLEANGGFSGGNGDSTGGYGNLLIHQTNNAGQTGVNDVDNPNDDGNGGSLVINSDIPLVEFEFSYIDLDDGVVAASEITFTDTFSGEFVTISFADLEGTSTSAFRTDDVDFGNDNANDVGAITLAELQTENSDLTQFDQITIFTAGSGGLGEFTVVTVPEPSSSLLIALGALSFTLRRRR